MQTNKIHILSTRPLDKAFIEEAAKQNIDVDEISFISTEPIISDIIEEKIKSLATQKINVVFTSMNAVNAVNNYLSKKPSWKIYCIGNTTKKLVVKFFGAESIAGTAENATQLAEKIISDKNAKAVTFFCGDHRRDDLPQRLKDNGIGVDEIVAYKTIETSQRIQKEYDGILFYSPSAVNSFFLKNKISDKTQLFAIGSTTANTLKHFTQQPVIIAEIPGKENLITLAINHFSNSKIS